MTLSGKGMGITLVFLTVGFVRPGEYFNTTQECSLDTFDICYLDCLPRLPVDMCCTGQTNTLYLKIRL